MSDTTDTSTSMSADRPIPNPTDDKLGYSAFAQHISDVIRAMPAFDGFVIGVNGPWGLGKSSVLNLVDYHLSQLPPDDNKPIVMRFNPWWFADREDLVRIFFDQLAVVLSEVKGSMRLELLAKEVAKSISAFAEVISEAPVPYAWLAKVVANGTRQEPRDVRRLKDDVLRDLKKLKTKVVVMIDDIDRLTAEETRQMFRVVKAVGDFPNVIYLLAFDRDIVAQAVEGTYGDSGTAYLEKIIQLPLEIPLPGSEALQNLFVSRLEHVIEDTSPSLFDQTRWANILLDGVMRFLSTPREVIRLVNAIAATYPAVKGEVNAVDFMGMETLRMFCPSIYEAIRTDPQAFSGVIQTIHPQDKPLDTLRDLYQAPLGEVPEVKREASKRLLVRLFPKSASVLEQSANYGGQWLSTWRLERRVCSPDVLPVYLRLTVPTDDISNSEMQAILGQARTAELFAAQLSRLVGDDAASGKRRLQVFLTRFQDHIESGVPSEYLSNVMRAFLDVGDDLVAAQDKSAKAVELGNDLLIVEIVFKLYRCMAPGERFVALRDAMGQGKAISVITDVVDRIIEEYEASDPAMPPTHIWALSPAQASQLKALAVDKIESAATSGSLLSVPDLSFVLSQWGQWTSEDRPRTWVREVISSDKALRTLLGAYLLHGHSQQLADVVGQAFWTFDTVSFASLLADPETAERLRQLGAEGKLTGQQPEVIAKVLQALGRQ